MSGEATLPDTRHLTGEDAIVQGADWSRGFILDYIDPDTGQITVWETPGFTAWMTIVADYNQPIELSCTTENGRLQTGVPGYTVVLALTNAVTSALRDWGIGKYDLFIKDPYNHRTSIYKGNISLERKVSP